MEQTTLTELDKHKTIIVDENNIPPIMSLDIPRGVNVSKTRQITRQGMWEDTPCLITDVYTLTRIR